MSQPLANDAGPQSLGSALRHNKLLILICTVLAGGLIWTLGSAKTASYSSSVKVLVLPILGNPFSPDSVTSGQQVTIAMGTEAQVVDSVPVATLSNKSLKNDWTAGSGVVTAVVPPNTQVVQIQFNASTPQAAQVGAATVAKAYLKYRSTETATTQKSRLALLDKQAKSLKASLDAASKAANSPSASPETTQRVQLFANQLVTLESTISSLQATGADPGRVVSPAQLPTKPSGLSPLLLAAAGSVLGLLGGVTLAIWRERRDRRIRVGTDLQVAGVPLLGHLPKAPRSLLGGARSRQDAARDVLVQELRTGILASAQAPFTLTLTAISKVGLAAEVAVHLGRSLSVAGFHVVLVAMGGDGEVERLLGITQTSGLSDVLLRHDSVRQHLVAVGGVHVLPAGPQQPTVQDLYSGKAFADLLARLQAECDYVLLVAPEASTPISMAIARVSDGLLLVGDKRRTRSDDVQAAAARAQVLGVRVLGLVVLSAAGLAGQKQPPAHLLRSNSSGGRGPSASEARVTSAQSESGDAPLLQT